MRLKFQICLGLTVALCLDSHAALPQTAIGVDERLDRIVPGTKGAA